MASLQKPKLLLLDEHTAALDPATAAKVLELSDRIVRENQLTAMMITHNMKDAIVHGNRLIMMNEGHIISISRVRRKRSSTKQDLLEKFAEGGGRAGRVRRGAPELTRGYPDRSDIEKKISGA